MTCRAQLATFTQVTITLKPLTHADVDDHIAGEDEQQIRWLTGGRGTVDTAIRHFDELAENARVGTGKQGFGVWWDGRLAGYVDADPDNDDGLQPDDVNIGYAVHPWARGNGVAVEAVALICAFIRDQALGSRAAIRVDPGNAASIRVAEKAGFTRLDEFVSATDTHPDGTAAVLRLYVREL